MKDYYELLEVSRNASDEVIARAYKVLAKKYHPDMNLDNPVEAEKRFKEITEAYEILSDPEKRKDYDARLKREQTSNNQSSQNTQNTSYNSQSDYNEYANNYENTPAESDGTNYYVDVNQLNELLKEHENAVEQAYNDAYVKALKNMGYEVVYEKTPSEKRKDLVRKLVFLLIVMIVVIIVLSFPGVMDHIKEFFKTITDGFNDLKDKVKL